MKCLVGLFFPFVLGVVLSVSLNSNVVHGIGDENLDRKADQMARKLINGVGEEEGPHPEAKMTLKADESVWLKYRRDLGTQWCTLDGRDFISFNLTLLECQLSCKERGPSCHAVEYWDDHGCHECTDLSKITEYTDTNDVSYPVYVWFRVISDWSKYKPHLGTQWCTVERRDIIDYNLSRLECQVRCEEKGPTCTAVEYWEEGNHACFECTDRSMITRYTNTTNPDYPVYVWVR